ncbi:hypothetical protein P7V44_21780 [Providencia sp. CRE-3FA-0001]|uniref:Uncharacterized protein n=1 Tax=Providencia huashanensis TaxID=3037798 RepID=A0AA42FSS1_9GAMM|nr:MULTISPECIES: hypothetical protein [unclassified Providencia]MDG4698858.1 hypothetical protein [Providencia sp. CRE-3FA-0001]
MISKGIEKLLDLAIHSGCLVYSKTNGGYELTKPNKKNITLIISPDGTAYRGDIDLTLAKTIRTQKEMRDILGLSK